MAESPDGVLREKLKVALRDAKRLFDENLIDENELKDLKAHELCKYKAQLNALTPTSTPQSSRYRSSDDTPPPQSVPHLPAVRKRGCEDDDLTLYVEPEIYERLTTPPIFRRRPRAKRRIVLKSADLAALQRDNTVA